MITLIGGKDVRQSSRGYEIMSEHLFATILRMEETGRSAEMSLDLPTGVLAHQSWTLTAARDSANLFSISVVLPAELYLPVPLDRDITQSNTRCSKSPSVAPTKPRIQSG